MGIDPLSGAHCTLCGRHSGVMSVPLELANSTWDPTLAGSWPTGTYLGPYSGVGVGHRQVLIEVVECDISNASILGGMVVDDLPVVTQALTTLVHANAFDDPTQAPIVLLGRPYTLAQCRLSEDWTLTGHCFGHDCSFVYVYAYVYIERLRASNVIPSSSVSPAPAPASARSSESPTKWKTLVPSR